MSKRQEKIIANKESQQEFLEKKKLKPFEDRWEESQIKAATMQSVLNYAIEQFTEHRDELEKEMITKELHDYIVGQIFQMRNLALLRVQELVEDGQYEQAILECQKLIK